MTADPVRQLLDDVARHLWRGDLARRMRAASWLAAGVLLAAACVHFAFARLAPAPVLLAAGLAALGYLVPALLQRPDDDRCARWADDHLGGESAFATLADLARGRVAPSDPHAVTHLSRWAAPRAEKARATLRGMATGVALAKPLAVLAASAAFALLALGLAGGRDDSGPPRDIVPAPKATADAAAARSTPASEPASDLAKALRRSAPTASATASAQSVAARDGAPDSATAPRQGSAAPTSTGTPADARGTPSPGADPSTATGKGGGTGRGAGDAADTRWHAAEGSATPPAPARPPDARAPSEARVADAGTPGLYSDDSDARPARAPALPRAAPASPPPATAGATLTPAQAAYVQAWIASRPTPR